jgi:hypothetical protein
MKHFAVAKDTRQPSLRRRRQLRHLVEKQDPGAGARERASTRKGFQVVPSSPWGHSKEHPLDFLRTVGARDDNERLRPPDALLVHGSSNGLCIETPLGNHEGTALVRSRLIQLRQAVAHLWRRSRQLWR